MSSSTPESTRRAGWGLTLLGRRTGSALVVTLLAASVAGCASTTSSGSTATPSPSTPPAAASTAPGATPTPSHPTASAAQDGGMDGDLAVGPMPAQLPTSGTGATTVLDVGGPDSTRSGRRVAYTVEMENGLPVSGTYFAQKVRRVLQDARGWEVRDGVHFVDVTPAERAKGVSPDIRIILASPDYVDRNCLPLQTGGRLSCHSRGKVLLNVDRWVHGAQTYGDDIIGYRFYQVSHEVGHSIGHGHEQCPAPGRPAPVMVQQTKSLYGCLPWPYPVQASS